MARSRKTPPLFEVMRETDRKTEESRPGVGHGAGQGGAPVGGHGPVILPRAVEPAGSSSRGALRGASESGKPRLEERQGVTHGREGHEVAHDDAAAGPGKGLVLPWPALLGGAGVLVAVVAVIAMLAFNAGAKKEREQLLPQDGDAPIVGSGQPERIGEQPEDPLNSREGERGVAGTGGGRGTRDGASRVPGSDGAAGANRGSGGSGTLSVFGADPREQGKNYLVIERLMFDDAMGAAQFLTDNGVPSVVVAPEGVEVSDLQQQPRGIWLVIAREGFTRDEFRASGPRSDEIKNAVIKLGRRWKQDHKGTTNFANCYWNKFGK